MGVLAVQGFKEIWRRWKAWLAADTLSEEDLAREEVADRFRSHLAECRKSWQASGMTEEEQKKAEETEISLILEKTESHKEIGKKAEQETQLSSAEMQAYVDTVCDQIRWKQTRKAVAEELTDHLLLQKEAFLTEGLSEEEAETRTVEEMGDGIAVGLALDRTHRPKPQWQMVLVAAVLLCMGLFCRLTIDQVSFGMGLLVPVFLAAAIFAGAYFLDFTLLARKAKWIFLLFLAMLILAVPFVEKSGGESIFFFFDYAYALTGLALLVPLPFLSMLFLTRRKGNRGYWFCWLAMAALAVVLLSFGKMSMVLMFVFSAYGAMMVAVRADWFSLGKQKGKRLLTLTTGAGIVAGMLAVFGMPALRYRLSFAVARVTGGEFGGGYFRYLVENIWENCRWMGSGTIPQNEMARSVQLVLSQRQDLFSNDILLPRLGFAYGKLAVALVLAVFALFFLLSFRQIRKQRSAFGRMTALSIWLVLLMQTVFFTAYNLGFTLVAPYALPLVSYGNTVLCINALLIGLLCSVFRRGEGVRDQDLASA